MTRFEEKIRLAILVLKALRSKPLTFTQLEKRTLIQCGTHSTFISILRYLKQQEFIEKAGVEHTAPYRITAKGLKFLEAWENEQPV
ncbi:MAG: hypothetical protein QXQ94_09380 [Candidatus Bathyarchaeia archaeon]